MDMQSAIRAVTEGRDLQAEQMISVMRQIMGGEATAAQIGGFLVGLRMKGETVSEIASAASVMRELATKVEVPDRRHLVDTCGTGGDSKGLFNVSTAAAFVVAAAGGRVAKHGNRSVSSSTGSADVLEAAGMHLDLAPTEIADCIAEVGVGFLFAPAHHGAMRHAVGPRREMGVRTIFNLLGPLTNPAGAPHQLLGVFEARWLEPLAAVLERLGSRHVLVVHSEDGLDEISVAAPTLIAELCNGRVSCYRITPEDLGLPRRSIEDLRVADARGSLSLIRRIFSGEAGAARDLVIANAGAAIYAADLTDDLGSGVRRAAEVIDSGEAGERLDRLIAFSRAAKGDS